MAADIMTKALGKAKHESFMEMTGMMAVGTATPSPVEDNYSIRKDVALMAWNSSESVEIGRLSSRPSLGAETKDWQAKQYTALVLRHPGCNLGMDGI